MAAVKKSSKKVAQGSQGAEVAEGLSQKEVAVKVNATITATLTPEERYRLIAEAAYFRAERRGFCEGHAEGDWLAAEREVDATLARLQKPA